MTDSKKQIDTGLDVLADAGNDTKDVATIANAKVRLATRYAMGKARGRARDRAASTEKESEESDVN